MPPFHERIAFSTLFIGLNLDWMSWNISFDLAMLNLSDNLKRFLLLLSFKMLLHCATHIGVICITPTELPLRAFSLPLLSTCMIAFITEVQSYPFVAVSELSAAITA